MHEHYRYIWAHRGTPEEREHGMGEGLEVCMSVDVALLHDVAKQIHAHDAVDEPMSRGGGTVRVEGRLGVEGRIRWRGG